MTLPNSSFWAITAYFNPCGYQTRLDNYKVFRRFLNVPLVTVELSFNGQFELTKDDADILVQIKGNEYNIMWQKERLLNIALEHLPEECDKLAWLDCDIIFADSNWHLKATKFLEKYPLVQLFKKVIHLPDNYKLDSFVLQKNNSHNSYNNFYFKISSTYNYTAEEPILSPRRSGGFTLNGCPGMAWASHKQLLLKHRFYDALIIGSGDQLMKCAAINNFERLKNLISDDSLQITHYLSWAKSFFSTVQGQIYFVDTDIFHLWHGNLNNRNYTKRHSQLEEFNFNPYADITLDDNGCWKWNSNKPELHQYLKDYFYARKEE